MSKNITPETNREKAIQIQAKIDTLTFVETYPCKCDKRKMIDLFYKIESVKWNYKKELEELYEQF